MMPLRKRIALIAHDNRKPDLVEWARLNRGTLARHELYATGPTGALVAQELDLTVNRFLSGPLGMAVAGSMIVSVGAYALLGGWWFGVGLVGLIFVHEM